MPYFDTLHVPSKQTWAITARI